MRNIESFFSVVAAVAAATTIPVTLWAQSGQERLVAQAQTMEVQLRNMPFAQSPPSDQALHVTMPDRTRLALNLYFPKGFDRSVSRAPAVYVQTLYGRNQEAAVTAIELYRGAGFVVIIGDVRGFGASSGYQDDLFGAQMQSDQRATLSWIAAQPWSNGKVAAAGLSISATPADIMTGSGSPALKAAVLRGEDFDLYEHDAFPGGVPNLRILALVRELYSGHRADACRTSLAACGEFSRVVQPVDGDSELRQLQAAVADRSKLDEHALDKVVYRDDRVGDRTFADASASAHVEAMRRAAVPARIGASWLDGTTAASALERFALLPDVAMQVIISSATHPGGLDADPFSATEFQRARPDATAQFSADVSLEADDAVAPRWCRSRGAASVGHWSRQGRHAKPIGRDRLHSGCHGVLRPAQSLERATGESDSLRRPTRCPWAASVVRCGARQRGHGAGRRPGTVPGVAHQPTGRARRRIPRGCCARWPRHLSHRRCSTTASSQDAGKHL